MTKKTIKSELNGSTKKTEVTLNAVSKDESVFKYTETIKTEKEFEGKLWVHTDKGETKEVQVDIKNKNIAMNEQYGWTIEELENSEEFKTAHPYVQYEMLRSCAGKIKKHFNPFS